MLLALLQVSKNDLNPPEERTEVGEKLAQPLWIQAGFPQEQSHQESLRSGTGNLSQSRRFRWRRRLSLEPRTPAGSAPPSKANAGVCLSLFSP